MATTIQLKTSGRVPEEIRQRAIDLLARYCGGETSLSRQTKNPRCKMLVIEVNRRYRLLDCGKGFELMSHEKYSKKLDKKR